MQSFKETTLIERCLFAARRFKSIMYDTIRSSEILEISRDVENRARSTRHIDLQKDIKAGIDKEWLPADVDKADANIVAGRKSQLTEYIENLISPKKFQSAIGDSIDNIVKYVLIKELVDDFIANLIFFEKQSINEIRTEKKLQRYGIPIPGQEEAFREAYSNYTEPTEWLKTGALRSKLINHLFFDFFDEFRLFNLETVDALITEINLHMSEYKKGVGNQTVKIYATEMMFDSVIFKWKQNLQLHVEKLTKSIRFVANLDDTAKTLSEKELEEITRSTGHTHFMLFISHANSEVKRIHFSNSAKETNSLAFDNSSTVASLVQQEDKSSANPLPIAEKLNDDKTPPPSNIFKRHPILTGLAVAVGLTIVAGLIIAFSGGTAAIPIAFGATATGNFIFATLGVTASSLFVWITGAVTIGAGLAAIYGSAAAIVARRKEIGEKIGAFIDKIFKKPLKVIQVSANSGSSNRDLTDEFFLTKGLISSTQKPTSTTSDKINVMNDQKKTSTENLSNRNVYGSQTIPDAEQSNITPQRLSPR